MGKLKLISLVTPAVGLAFLLVFELWDALELRRKWEHKIPAFWMDVVGVRMQWAGLRAEFLAHLTLSMPDS